MLELALAFGAGLLLAAATTPVGISGAVLLLPVQMSVLGVPSPSVTATNLLYNVVAVPGSLARFGRRGRLWSPLTRLLLAGAVPGMVLGAVLRILVVPDATSFRVVVAGVLFVLGCWLLVRRAPVPNSRASTDPPSNWVIALAVGAGLIGVGGGSLLAPVLVAGGLAPAMVAPAALSTTYVTSLTGVATFVVLSLVGHPAAAPDWSIALACGLGGLLGGWLGVGVQDRLPAVALARLLGALCVAVALGYLL